MKPTQWDYEVVPVHPDRMKIGTEKAHVTEGMKAQGMQGWELVSVIRQQEDGWVYLFYKRPIEEK